jgi:hypothetical protein
MLNIVVAQAGKQRLSPAGMLLLAHVSSNEELSQTYGRYGKGNSTGM